MVEEVRGSGGGLTNSLLSVCRVPAENVERRESRDNLEQLDLLEDEDDLETMDLKETLYDSGVMVHVAL